MQQRFVTLLGKSVKKLAEARGGGSALPGLFVEKIDPNFISRTLADLPRGVVLISGTNGKTTTTKMVVELLESQGMRVFTNRTGSNFTRGVAAALLGEITRDGVLDADIAVLELDEAHAVHFVRSVKPAYSLLLNVMRDQLDRFGEIDTTAKLLRTIAENTTGGIVVNRDDPRLGTPVFIEGLSAPVRTYGVAPALQSLFPSDDNMREDSVYEARTTIEPCDDVSLETVSEPTATITYGDATHTVTLKLKGVYNILNATGAVALTRMVMGRELSEQSMLAALEKVTPAFGRGETLIVDGKECELVLVKNPSGFRLSLKSFNPSEYATMIAINDNYADGRDMSWLWDVEFDSLKNQGVAMVSGVRAFDMALRLQYDEIEITSVVPSIQAALESFIRTETDKPKRIFCTYTAMLAIRRELSKQTNVEVVR